MKKRLISLLLAGVMLLSLLPVTALADMIPDLTAEELAYNASLMQRRLEQCEEDTYGVRQFWLEHDGANEISTLAIRNIGGKKLKFWGYGYPLTAHQGIQVEDDFEVEFYQLNLVGDLTVIPGSSSSGILGYVALTSFGQVHGDIINTGAGTVSIQEGTFYGALRNTGSGRIAVQGGTFYQKPDESFLSSGYRLLERTDEKGVTYWDAKPLFYAMDIFAAGSMEPGGNNTLGGEYRSILNDETIDRFDPSRMKARFMGFATEVRFGYPKTFMLEGSGACTRELTLYSDVDLDAEKLNVSTLHQFQTVKPTLVEPFTKGVFGDDGGELYYYTAPVSFPASSGNPMLEMEVFYDDMPIFNTYIVHTAPFADYNMSYIANCRVRSYTQNAQQNLDTITLEVGGMGLPVGAEHYSLGRYDLEEHSLELTSYTPPNELGVHTMVFTVVDDPGADHQGLNGTDSAWLEFKMNGDAQCFFEGNNATEYDSSLSLYKPKEERYNYGVPVNITGFYCLYASPYDEPDTAPTLSLPGLTKTQTVEIPVTPGSYDGGTVRWTVNGKAGGSAELDGATRLRVTLGEDLGEYQLRFSFHKNGLRVTHLGPYTVEYNDGIAAAPTAGGVTGAEKTGRGYVIFGGDTASFTFWTQAPQGRALEALFVDGDGAVLARRDMSWSGDRYTCAVTKAAIPGATASVQFRVKAEPGGEPGKVLSVPVKVIANAYLEEVYVPQVPFKTMDDGKGGSFRRVEAGAVLTGAFQAVGEPGWTRRMVLDYTDTDDQTQSVAVNAQEAAGGYTASITLPADVKELVQVSYEIKNDLEARANNALRYDMSAYKTCALTTIDVTNIPAAYQDGILEFTNGTVTYTRAISAGLEFADLPAGEYTFKLLSSSGGIDPEGTFTVGAGSSSIDLAASNDFPETCSVTLHPSWRNETTYLSGEEWDRPLALPVRLELNYQGKDFTLTGVTDVPITGIPKGASGVYYVEPTGDSREIPATVTVTDPVTGNPIQTEITVSDKAGEIRRMDGGYNTITSITEDVSWSFGIYPYTKHKVVGTVYDSSADPKPIAGAEVTIIQEVNRGYVAKADGTGLEVRRKEEVRLTTTTDENGDFSINIYDLIEGNTRFNSAIEIRHPAYNSYKNDRLPTTKFDAAGVEYLTAMNLRKSSAVAIAVELLLQDTDERDNANNVLRQGGGFTPGDSSALALSYVSCAAGTLSEDQYEVYTVDGQLYIKIAEGVTLTDFIDIGFLSSGSIDGSSPDFEYNGKPYQFCNERGEYDLRSRWLRLDIPERDNEEGIALYKATIRARRMGVEHVATVVEDAESGYVGFLWDQEDYVSGVGALSLISYSGKHVYAFRIREADAKDMEEMLSGSIPEYFMKNYVEKYNNFYLSDPSQAQFLVLTSGTRQNPVSLPLKGHNKTFFHGVTYPPMPVDNNILPPFIFDYTIRQANSDSKAMLTGTLRRRWPVSAEDATPAGLWLSVDTGDGQGWQAANDIFYVDGHLVDAGYHYLAIPDSVEISGELPQVGVHGIFENKVKFRIEYGVAGLRTYKEEFESPVGEGLSMDVPEEFYIQTECRKQGYWDQEKPEEQAQWTVTLPINLSDPRVKGKTINILDNGVVIDTFEEGSLGLDTAIFTVEAGYSYLTGKYRRTVRLLNNMQPGIHVLRAVTVPTKEGEEPISTVGYPVAVYAGLKPSSSTEVSNISWYMRGSNSTYNFSRLSQIGSKTISIAKNDTSNLRFTINCPTDFIRKVTVRVNYVVPTVYTNVKTIWGYQLVYFPGGNITRDIDATCSSHGVESSVWGASFSMNNFSSFEILIERVDNSKVGDTYEDMQLKEASGYYERMGATLPDNAQRITDAAAVTQAQLEATAAENTEYLPAVLQLEENDAVVTQNDENGYVITATSPNDGLKELTYSITPLAETPTTDLWQRMAREQETGVSLDPDEAGWEIAWAPSESVLAGEIVQSYTRTASINRQLPDGTWQNAVRRQVYMPDWVMDAMETAAADNSGSQASLFALGDETPEVPVGEAISAQLMATRKKTKTKEEFYQKMHDDCMKGYEFWSNAYTVSDISNDIWTSQKLAQWQRGADATANSSFISKGASNTMNVVGAVGAIYQYSQGPSGSDSTGLRELLRNVRDSKARESLGKQLDDYDKVRNAIFRQETAMNAVNAGGGFVASNPVVKVGMFLGGIANGVISGWSKDYNQQVYNSTLHDIQRQIQYEGQKELKAAQNQLKKDLKAMHRWYDYKSFDDALRDFVLIRSTSGKLVYVDKCYAPAPKVYIDPSGYVFEAVTGEKLEGVTTTVLYAPVETDANGQAVVPTNFSVWVDDNSDEEERQPNPMDSRADGSYGWMVPYGWWKVRYEKEGYLPTESKIMQVPPEHTAVNIGMLSTQAPYLSVSREDDGTYTVLFTKYMQLESLIRLAGVTDEGDVGVGSQGAAYTDNSFDSSTFAIRFFDAAGNPVFGTVTFPDKAANTGYKGDGSGIYTGENGYATDFIASDWFVRKAVFTPSDPTAAIDLSRTTFASGIVSYAGVALPDSPIKSVYEIRFDANGGAFATGSLQTDDYGKLSGLYDLSGQPTAAFTPTREGYDFDGWYTAAQGGVKVSNDTAYFKNTTLYAHWTAQVPPLSATFCDDQDGGWLLLLNGLARLDTGDAVILASYDDSGKMLSVKNYTKSQFDDVDGTGRLTVTKPADANVVKAFLLSGGACTPIRKPAIWNAE